MSAHALSRRRRGAILNRRISVCRDEQFLSLIRVIREADVAYTRLDYLYGGLVSTWKALDEAGMVHAGTGRNPGEARDHG